MKLLSTILLFFICANAFGQSAGQWSLHSYNNVAYNGGSGTNVYKLFKTKDSASGIKPAVYVEMQGIGEKGTLNHSSGTMGWLADNGATMRYKKPSPALDSFSMWIVTPMLPSGDASGIYPGTIALDVIKHIKANYGTIIDTNRIYLGGYSLGGGGVFNYISLSPVNGSIIAGFAIDEGTTDWTSESNFDANVIADSLHGRSWYSLATDNPTVLSNEEVFFAHSTGNSTLMQYINFYRTVNGNHSPDGATRPNDSVPTNTYQVDSSFTNGNGNIKHNVTYTNSPVKATWLYQWTRKTIHTNFAPTANAGSNQSITLPTTSVTLTGSGSSDVDGSIVAYSWVKTSGPNTPTFSNSSVANPTVSGLIVGTYVFTLTVTDDSAATGSASTTVVVNSNVPTWTIGTNVGRGGGYKLRPYELIDIIGSNSRSANKHEFMYDDYNDVDPAAGSLTFSLNHGVNNFLPEKQTGVNYPADSVNAIVHHGTIGNLWVADMVGDTDANNLTNKVEIDAWYAAENSFEVGDSIDVFPIDTIWSKPIDSFTLYLAHPSTYLQRACVLVTTGHQHQWTSVLSTGVKKSRYWEFRARLKNRGAYLTTPLFTEVVMYGKRWFDSSTVVTWDKLAAAPVKKTKAPFVQENGSGTGVGYPTEEFSARSAVRGNGNYSYYDTLHTNATASGSVYTKDYFLDIGPAQYDTFAAKGINFWWNLKGVSNWYVDQFGTRGGNPVVPFNTRTGDPYDPYAFTKIAKFVFNFTALWGSVAVNSSRTQWAAGGRSNGQNKIHWLEIANEIEFSGGDPMIASNLLIAVFNGRDGLYGTDYGMKSADPSMKLVMAGMVERDKDRIWAIIWLNRVSTPSRITHIDVFNFHNYAKTLNDFIPQQLSDSHGATGRSPERDKEYQLDNDFVQFTRQRDRNDTTKLYAKTEYGYGHTDTVTNYDHFNYDIGNVAGLKIPGFTSEDSRSIMLTRSAIGNWLSYLDLSCVFFQHNSSLSTTISPQLYESYGETAGKNVFDFKSTVKYESYQYNGSFNNIMPGWLPYDTVYGGRIDSLGVNYVMMYKVSQPDSIAVLGWKGATTDTSTAITNIVLPSNVSGNWKKSKASFTDFNPIQSTITGNGSNILAMRATVEPQVWEAKLGTPVALPAGCPCTNYYLKRYP